VSHQASEEPSRIAPPDYGFFIIIGLVAVIAAWLLLFPFVTPIAETTLNRFHFKTASFWQWAVQQPVPAMYSFRNTYEVTRPGRSGREDFVAESGTINHFPLRVVTFANGRYRNLLEREDVDVHVTSTYRGHRLESDYRVKSDDNGVFQMRSLDQPLIDEKGAP